MTKRAASIILVTLFIAPVLFPLKLIAASQKRVYGVVQINNQQFNVEVSDTIFKKQLGLGGRKSLNANEGMLFPFKPASSQTFWMKDMLIPIDIIWIRAGKVIGISANLPPPNKSNNYNLSITKSPGSVDNVLEIKAGRAAELKIKVGDKVKINPK